VSHQLSFKPLTAKDKKLRNRDDPRVTAQTTATTTHAIMLISWSSTTVSCKPRVGRKLLQTITALTKNKALSHFERRFESQGLWHMSKDYVCRKCGDDALITSGKAIFNFT
jgi:hypothetical protein